MSSLVHATAANLLFVLRHDVLHCRAIVGLEQRKAWCNQGQELRLLGSTRAAQ